MVGFVLIAFALVVLHYAVKRRSIPLLLLFFFLIYYMVTGLARPFKGK